MNLSKKIEIKFLADCKQHIPYLAKLWYEQISKQWVPAASIARNTENLLKHANKNTLPLTLVALENNEPLGMASLRENDGIQPERAPWLGSLVVDPLHRGQKIGEQLIEAIRTQAKIFDREKLYLLAFDSTIPTWYTKLGWKHIGHDKLFNHPVTVMEYDLSI